MTAKREHLKMQGWKNRRQVEGRKVVSQWAVLSPQDLSQGRMGALRQENGKLRSGEYNHVYVDISAWGLGCS